MTLINHCSTCEHNRAVLAEALAALRLCLAYMKEDGPARPDLARAKLDAIASAEAVLGVET